LRCCDVGITDGRDIWSMPLRWVQVAWYIGVGQINGNTTDTLHISLLMWYWFTFCPQYSCSPSWNQLIQVLNNL
jgi:hypothetical protein